MAKSRYREKIEEKLEIIVTGKQGIREAVECLDKLLEDDNVILSKRLRHYLGRRSYGKALKDIRGL